jgi:hypothetical protein
VVVEQLPVGVAQVAHFLPSAFAGAIDKAATARLATMRDNVFIALPFQVAGRTCRPKAYDNTVQLSVATGHRAQRGNRSADFLEVRKLDSMSPFVKGAPTTSAVGPRADPQQASLSTLFNPLLLRDK